MEEQVELSLGSTTQIRTSLRWHPGCMEGSSVSFELLAGAKPYHAKPYPIPYVHEMPTKKEVERLCKLGVLEPCNDSEWGAPLFIIPKKNQTIRFLSNFRRLNAMLKRKPLLFRRYRTCSKSLKGFGMRQHWI